MTMENKYRNQLEKDMKIIDEINDKKKKKKR